MKKHSNIRSAFFLSIAFALINCPYYILLVKTNRGGIYGFMQHPLVVFALGLFVLVVLFNAADRWNVRNVMTGADDTMRLGRYALVMLLAWIPFFIMCFPGNTFYDTGASILYALNIYRSNVNNPWFQNIIIGCAYRVGERLGSPNIGVAIYVIIQFAFYIVTLSHAIILFSNTRTVRLILTLFYALIPVFPLYALTMGKDTNFALTVLWFLCLTYDLVNDADGFLKNRPKLFALAITVTLMGLFRNHAVL